MLFFFLLLDALSGDTSQTTVMATHKGAPQVVLHEGLTDEQLALYNQEEQEELADTSSDTDAEN